MFFKSDPELSTLAGVLTTGTAASGGSGSVPGLALAGPVSLPRSGSSQATLPTQDWV